MAAAGVVDREPLGPRDPGSKDCIRFPDEGVLALRREALDLAPGDVQPEAPQHPGDSRHRALPFVIRQQGKALYGGREVAGGRRWQLGGHGRAVRQDAPLRPVDQMLRVDAQHLYVAFHEVLAMAALGRIFDENFDPLRRVTPPLATAGDAFRLRPRRPFPFPFPVPPGLP